MKSDFADLLSFKANGIRMRWIASTTTFAFLFACAVSVDMHNPSRHWPQYAQCRAFHEIHPLADMCPTFQPSDLDAFQDPFADVNTLIDFDTGADRSLLFEQLHKDATKSTAHGMPTIATQAPLSRSTHKPFHTTSAPRNEQTLPKHQGPLLSFEEWQKRVLQDENERPHSKRKPGGKPGLGTGPHMVDSIDGLVDDLGSMFEAVGEGVVTDNVYDEKAYIEPSRSGRPATEPTHLKKPRIADVPIKSLKERFNYASIDCAATVRGVNKAAKGAQSILFESKDQYMLNKCATDKYVIINLCEAVLIDTIVMGNFEFFSSTFKDFRVYVADRYPTKEWYLLGQWQARNTRDLQVFKVNNRIGWFEYIKIEFLTHYGHEYYCPLSLVRVHGMSMMEYYNRVESQGLSSDDAMVEDEYLWPADIRDAIISPKMDYSNNTGPISTLIPEQEEEYEQATMIPPITQCDSNCQQVPTQDAVVFSPSSLVNEHDVKVQDDMKTVPVGETLLLEGTAASIPNPEPAMIIEKMHDDETEPNLETTTPAPSPKDEALQPEHSRPLEETLEGQSQVIPLHSAKTSITNTGTHTDIHKDAHSETLVFGTDLGGVYTHPASSTSSQIPGTSSSHLPETSDVNVRIKPPPILHGKEGNTQESIYKTIMKRLNALEVNATMSQRYLEEQSTMLNNVFISMEKRHQEQLVLLLEKLNEAASARIEAMKRRYEILQEELLFQAENDKREMTARVSLLAEQIAFERRVSMAQLVIVITLFVFVALSRGTLGILSPILEAQARERKRRESVSRVAPTPSASSTSHKPTTNGRRPSKVMRTLSSVTQSSWSNSTLSLMSMYSNNTEKKDAELTTSSERPSPDATVPETGISPECDKFSDDGLQTLGHHSS